MKSSIYCTLVLVTIMTTTCNGQKPKAEMPPPPGPATAKHVSQKDTVKPDTSMHAGGDSLLMTDAEEFDFNNAHYRAFKVDVMHQRVIIYGSAGHGAPANSIRSIYSGNMKSQKQVPLMITNGGMFDPDFSPHGLLVSNKHLYKTLDTLAGGETAANFYLQPNGVFYIDKGKYFILPTRSFHQLYPEATSQGKLLKEFKGLEFATQSGPMLLVNDTINKAFTQGSRNRKIRSGVGMMPNGSPVFVISDDEVNFYDFATLFQIRFQCKEALFLDGVISRMFIADIHAGETALDLSDNEDGTFGPMIGVIRK